jgi:hypothetical protein
MGRRSNVEGLSPERNQPPRSSLECPGTDPRFGQKSERPPKIGGPSGLIFQAL